MKCLLDTHTFLWAMLTPERIGNKTGALMAEGDSQFFLSIASVWELAIKTALGKLQLPKEPLTYVQTRTQANGIALLPIALEHVCASAKLPRWHGDPFDRMLIAQAQIEKMILVSGDRAFKRYKVDLRDPQR